MPDTPHGRQPRSSGGEAISPKDDMPFTATVVARVRGRKPGHGDEDEMWLRKLTLPEEYIIRHHPIACGKLWRWFQSENVIDLVRIRHERAKQHGGK